MNIQELFESVADSLPEFSESMEQSKDVFRDIQCLACLSLSDLETGINDLKLSILKNNIVGILPLLIESSLIIDSHCKKGFEFKRTINELTKSFLSGFDSKCSGQDKELESLLVKINDAASAKNNPLIAYLLGASCSNLDLEPSEIYKLYLSNAFSKIYLEKIQSLAPLTDNGKHPSTMFQEILTVLLIDEPYSTLKALKKASFTILDNMLEIERGEYLLNQG